MRDNVLDSAVTETMAVDESNESQDSDEVDDEEDEDEDDGDDAEDSEFDETEAIYPARALPSIGPLM